VTEAGAPTAWQGEHLVHEFLSDRQRLLPLLEVQEALVKGVFERGGRRVGRFLDVGAGAGAMTELLHAVAPDAEAVLLDNSAPMLAAAERRLRGSGRAWRTVRADLRDRAWRDALDAGANAASYDAAVSGLAIHHLTSSRKRELFAELFEVLEPGAMFVNMDVVTVAGPLAGLFDEHIIANATALERERGGGRSDEEIEQQWLADGDDDRPDSAAEQLLWLTEAGFVDVELHFKWAEGAIFGATKPREGGN
jgi:tRNA (cmo5U34)-methyltransferase